MPWANEREKQGEEHRLTPLPTSYCAFTPTEAHTEAKPCVKESTLSKKKTSAVKDNIAPILYSDS